LTPQRCEFFGRAHAGNLQQACRADNFDYIRAAITKTKT
jgi:hypothetical protein